MRLAPEDRDLIIRTVIGEAANQDDLGKAAVAHVILNRVGSGRYGDTVPDVVFAPKQFEPWQTRAGYLRAIPESASAYQRAGLVVDEIAAGRIPDPTNGATHFANVATVQQRGNASGMSWINDMKRNGTAVKIGDHTFGSPDGQPGARAPRAPSSEPLAQAGPRKVTDPALLKMLQADDASDDGDDEAPAPSPSAKVAPAAASPGLKRVTDPALLAALTTDAPSPPTDPAIARGLREAEPSREQRSAAFEEQERGRIAQQNATPAGRALGTVDTVAQGIARGIPFRDDIAALTQTALGINPGSTREENLDRLRARGRARDEADPVASYGGQLAGAAALPGGAVASSGVKGGLAVGAAYGAAQGAGQGDGFVDRAQKAATGAAVGGALGGAFGGLAARVLPAPAAAANPAVEAAERLAPYGFEGLPKAVATESVPAQWLAAGVQKVPFAGTPLVKAAERATTGLGEAADNVAAGFGGARMEQAGESASEGVAGWIGDKSKRILERAYNRVDQHINPNVTTDLNATRGTVAQLAAEKQAAGLPMGQGIDLVLGAVQRPGGLTFDGIKTMRTRVGEMLDTGILPADMSKADLKRLYGGLTDDLTAAAENAGGPAGKAAFQAANSLAAKVAERRESLVRIVGKNGQATPAQVYDRLKAAAGGTSRAETSLLREARKAIGPDGWEDVAAAVTSSLGRDKAGAFSPDRFRTDYGKLSDEGKALLFGTTGQGELARALDDIMTVTNKFAELRKFANPSGTGQQAGFVSLGAGMMAAPLHTAATVLGGNVVARVLATPATASSMARWSRAYELAVRKPAAGTVAGLQIASRNLASTIGEKLGVQVAPEAFLRALSGPVASRADEGEAPTLAGP